MIFRNNFPIHGANIFNDDVLFFDTILDEMTIILNIYSKVSNEQLICYQNNLYYIMLPVTILKKIKKEEPTLLLTSNFKIVFFIINDLLYNHKQIVEIDKANELFLLFNSLNQFHDIFKFKKQEILLSERKEAKREGKKLMEKIRNDIHTEASDFLKKILKDNGIPEDAKLTDIETMRVSELNQPKNIYKHYDTIFRNMKMDKLIEIVNDNKELIKTIYHYYPIYETLSSFLDNINIFMCKYFTEDRKFITQNSNWREIKYKIETIIKNINIVFDGSPELMEIDEILSKQSFRDLYFQILNTELVKSFLYNPLKIGDKAFQSSFFSNNIKTLILPESIKGFTNRFSNIFLNKTGYKIHNTVDKNERQMVFYFNNIMLVT